MSRKCLFCLDIDGIQDYIFNTNRVRTIVGASLIISRLNSYETVNLIRDKYGFGKKPEDEEGFINSSGGHSKLIFENHDDAYEFDQIIHRKYEEAGVSITTNIETFDPNSVREYDVLKRAAARLAQSRYNKKAITALTSSPYFKICENCGKEYAQYFVKESDSLAMKDLVICRYCEAKLKEKVSEFAGLPFKFKSQLEEFKGRNGMIALVVMDGNNMAEKIDAVTSSSADKAFSALKKFSQKTEYIFSESIKETIISQQPGVQDKKDEEVDFIRPIIVGGDDVCCVVKAEYGLEFAESLIQKIKEKSIEHGDNKFGDGIHMCAGIVFMRHNYPFNVGYRVAQSLLHSAKRLSRKNNDQSMIDFQVMQSASALDIFTIRQKEYSYQIGGDIYSLTAKPYSIEPVKKKTIKSIKDFYHRLSLLKGNLAGSKLEYIRSIMRKGRDTSTYELAKIFSKIVRNKREFFKNFLENDNLWFREGDELKTDFLDLIEMSDLLEV
jgi:DNA-directed RNA polymerase subunit RPC12/RpoP